MSQGIKYFEAGGDAGGGGPSDTPVDLVQEVLKTDADQAPINRDYGFGDGGPQATAAPITTATTATPGGIYNFSPAAYQPVRYAPQYDQFGQGIASLFGSDYSRLFGPRGAMPPAPAPGGGGGGGTIPGGGGGGGGGYTPIAPPPPGINPPAPAPNPYTVTPSMTPAQIASIYNNYVMANGGVDNEATRTAAAQYLQSVGLNQSQIDAAYSYYLGNFGMPKPAPAPSPYPVTPNMSAQEVANLYNQFVTASGGKDTQQTRDAAADYLRQAGLSQAQIDSAYQYYLNSYGPRPAPAPAPAPTAPAPAPNPYAVTSSTSPAQIASLYNQFVLASGGTNNTQTQQAAIDYLRSAGISDDTINAAYELYLSRYS